MGFLLLIVILGLVVVVHEWGHYIAAKKFGVKVEEFGFGFPPRAKKLFKRGETEFTLNWIPFGGFVKLFGENPDDALRTDEDQARNMNSKAKWKQAVILVAGVFMNFVLAGVLFSAGFMTGMPMSVDVDTVAENKHVVISNVQKGSPAQLAGLPAGVQLVSLDGNTEAAATIPALQAYINAHANKPVVVGYELEKDKLETVTITPKENLATQGRAGIGVSLDYVGEVKLPFFKAVGEGFVTAGRMVAQIFIFFIKFIGGLFGSSTGVSSGDVTGPVGIAGLATQAFKMGSVYLLTFIAIISANLAVLNLIPFPALDGGRLLFLGIEAVTRRKLNQNVVGWVNTIGFGLLIVLMLFVTYKDVVKLF